MAGHNNSSNGDSQQQKTQHPVQFEITEQTRTILEAWMRQAHLRSEFFSDAASQGSATGRQISHAFCWKLSGKQL
jgi:hypothetical protein